MAKNRNENPLELGSGSVVAIGFFLLAWNVVEVCTGTVPFKDAPPGTTQLAASQAGAMVTPSDRGSARDQSPGEPWLGTLKSSDQKTMLEAARPQGARLFDAESHAVLSIRDQTGPLAGSLA